MDKANRSFSDVLGLLKSWVPWRSEPSNVSRDFWMPDESCMVCYECDSQFTLFNRRHHCRLCGRIFCAKCTSNWIPVRPSEPNVVEEWDRIRVCNYCFKQREQGQTGTVDNDLQATGLEIGTASPSATSFVSSKSSGTCGSSSITFASLPQSAGFSPRQSVIMETTAEMANDHCVDQGEQNRSQKQFEFFQSRSDDDDEDLVSPQLSSRTSHFSQVNGYYEHPQFDDNNSDYKSDKVHPDGDAVDSKSLSTSSFQNSFTSLLSEEVQQIVRKGAERDIVDECEAPSSLYSAEDVDAQPVDFENDGLLWLPPEPEDEEDEREAFLFEGDDDAYASGDWGYYRNSSFGSGESRNRDRSNEEHKRAMKTVVDGHFRALVSQLLQVENLLNEDENDKESWLEIITALSWEAATFLKPDMSKGGQMDPGGYVKVKCLASGLRSESLVIKGIVCKKNVAHRRMASKIEKPRVLILGGALEYQRVSNALSSLDTLLQQEMDHLKMAVAKIGAQKPDILLVEKSVSRHAQEYLLAKGISLVLNIKRPLLERISRCTGAQMVPSIDNLSPHKLGYCDMFHVERYLEEHGSAGQAGKKLVKTLMYFEGCPKPLGCTILLRGANGDELKKVKHVVQYGVFAAYHLALETSFLADEGASLPELPLNSPITVALPDKTSTIVRSISTIPDLMVPSSEKFPGPQSVGEPHRSNSVPTSHFLKETVASICETERLQKIDFPTPMSPQYVESPVSFPTENFQHSLNVPSANHASDDQSTGNLTMSSEVPLLEADRGSVKGDLESKIMRTELHDIDANRSILDPLGQPALKEDIMPSPSDHQSILVSLSSRCVWKGTVCERSHLSRIKYYGSFDKPLGRFLHDQLFDQSYVCRKCELPAEAHVQCYTHRQGTLTISVKKLSKIILTGDKDGKIWMWHRCLRCPRINGFPPAIKRIVMSDAAWGLSFGKFLELSFSNHAAATRVASCGHSLHRDCLRFYGYGNSVACFRYAPIDVHSVYLPPSKLGFNYERQEWLERELNEVIGRAELLFSEVLNAICLLVEKKSGTGLLSSGMNIPEWRRKIADAEEMLQKEKLEFEESIQKILNKEAEKGQPVIDILELNRLRRQLVFQSYMWDRRLVQASSLDVKNRSEDTGFTSPVSDSENILETEKILDIHVSAEISKITDNTEPVAADAMTYQISDSGTRDKIINHLDVVHQRNDAFIESDQGNQNLPALGCATKAADGSDPLVSRVTVRRALSEGQAPACLSDTLDAAWTGETCTGKGIHKNKSFSGTVETESSNIALLDKFDAEDRTEDLNVPKVSQLLAILSTKGSDNAEDTINWLGIPFQSFYQSLNKNFLVNAQRFLSDYAPVYISSLQESEVQCGARLLLPVGVNGTILPVYDDEPTSIIAYALVSSDYISQMSNEPDGSVQSLYGNTSQSLNALDEILDSSRSIGSGEENVLLSMSSSSSLSLDPVSYDKALHARVSFMDEGSLGKAKYLVTCYYAKRFEALRRICCPSEMNFIRSLSRCKKWGAQGGKSNVFFAKTLDDRFIIKQVTKTELESFIKFAPDYFKYLSESISTGSPTCLAKILGIYQVTSKHLRGGKEIKMDVLVMENLLFGRNVTRLYDLKGSSRSRYNADSTGSNKVLLDQNLLEDMPTSPIFVGNKAKRLLERAVWNDTGFLNTIDVMDYSLLVGIDEERHELVLGIIDFMRQYTWDKHLETWVKASGILGGPKNASPTVISPKEYKMRFRKAMTTYFLMVPDQWSPHSIIPSKSQSELSEENPQNVQSFTPGD